MTTLTIVQSILAIFLVILILIQNRGAGIGSTWGGSGESYITRRGLDKLLFRLTILDAVLFIIVSFAAFLS
ncbi:MAG: preprotein translocase subunit SecG [Patescibacteria group bacterium]